MNSLYKNLIFWTIIVIVMVLLFNLFSKPRQTASEKNYSEFISALENNRIQEVEALGRNLTWKDKDGKRFKTYAPEDPEMIKILREKGVIINAKKERRNHFERPNITIHSPNPATAKNNFLPWFFRMGEMVSNITIMIEPMSEAAFSQPKPIAPIFRMSRA